MFHLKTKVPLLLIIFGVISIYFVESPFSLIGSGSSITGAGLSYLVYITLYPVVSIVYGGYLMIKLRRGGDVSEIQRMVGIFILTVGTLLYFYFFAMLSFYITIP